MPATKSELWSDVGDSIVLNGLKCSGCGLLIFPPQHYGCPGCGTPGGRLEPAAIPAVGRLHSFAVVNVHQKYPTPYTIAEVALDAGPLVRALLDDAGPHRVNDRVKARAMESESAAQIVFGKIEGQPS